MPIQNKKSAALLSRSEDVTPKHSSVRRGDEKRGSSDSRLEAFANKIRPEPAKKPMIDRRRKRLTTADVSVPKQQINMNAVRFGLRGLDIMLVCAIIAIGIWNGYIGVNDRGIAAPVAASVLGSIIFIVALFVSNAYRFNAATTLSSHLKTVAIASFAALGVWLTIALIVRPETFLPDALAKAGLGAIALLTVLHGFYHTQIRRLHSRGALAPTIVMLGATESARRIIEENAKSKELNILGIFDDRMARAPHNIHGVPVVGTVDDLLAWDALPYVNRIVVTLPSMANKRKEDFVNRVRLLPNRIAFVVDEFETLNHVQQRVSEIAEISLRDVTGNPKSGRHTAVKRLLDIGISSVALILGAPVLALIALLIRLDSPGPALFKQPRHGFNNRVFDVYKFRSMRNDKADLKAEQQTTVGDARVTKIGRFIRKTSLDELPQLLNVLKGEMSLVGPRPHAVGMKTEGKASIELVAEYAHRHKVKPGMTGWAQINGSRGPLHTADDVAERVRLDVEYIEQSNVLWDILIMLKTLPVLLGDRSNAR
ncbi:exopolysaccharide biosynthesis polyprenyl glycosylphosphotransferase [Litorimonas cladophorae]|uniref:exopolysaccharide biosynthesis polyprenyl glycosylphosphotransferase n=1 Tax=Litorimonas cladophorae TaxID=1220491 RepID=UPI001675D92A|nr:exopolysaccharide biosynthesis polyprenyl glycosylphosphotransferase [Litorimonas cladophorae]